MRYFDDGGGYTPSQSTQLTPSTGGGSFDAGSFRLGEERSMRDYYSSGSTQSSVVDEQTRLAGLRNADLQAEAQRRAAEVARRAAEDAELAADRAAARQAQEDAARALEEANANYRSMLEAKAAADRARSEAEANAARLAAEEEERRRQAQYNQDFSGGYTPSNTTSSYSPSPVPLTPSTILSKPSNISPVTQTPPPPPVKTAAIDTILFDEEAVPIQIMSDLIFENIGGQELINIARNDTVNGQKVIYQPIKNLTSIQQAYNPNNIVALQDTSDKYFQNFSIKLDIKIPMEGTGPNGSHVYIDPTTGSLVIEAVNMSSDEQIEVEITTGGTIYEAEL